MAHADARAQAVTRFLWLFGGLYLFGASLALMVRSEFGLGPWDVLHQGVSRRLGLPIGWVIIGVGVLLLLAWVPLRQRPGFGTISNVVVVGLAVNLTLAGLPPIRSFAARVALLVVGIVANGVATGLYIGAGMGPGPRDGLMTGLARKGHSVATVRTLIEVSVLGLGLMLGGTAGVGTIAYALSIGPLAHYFMPRLELAPDPSQPERRPDTDLQSA